MILTPVASGVIIAGLTILALMLGHHACVGRLYPYWSLLAPVTGILLVLEALIRPHYTRPLLPAAVLFVYLCYAVFLIPLDHGPGRFKGEGVEAVLGETVWAPANFNAREESYAFLLPGAMIRPYDHKERPPADAPFAVISTRLDQEAPDGVILARRLNMIDRFDAAETRDILLGNVTRNLFRWDWLVQRN